MKLGLISLGCEKNKIDSELFLGVAKKYNLDITNNIHEADIIVVNTCGFINSAKEEAINTILEVCEYKKNNVKIVCIGCLVERYLDVLKEKLPEVDFYFPIRDYNHIDELFNKLTNTSNSYKFDYKNRILTTSNTSVYVRISDGCDNLCAYCAIPLIRGKYKSRPFNDILDEVNLLVSNGAKEITLIAQDTTRYGIDLNENKRLEDLLHEISLIANVKWIRVLYLYPDEISDKLLNEFKTNDKVVKYFDIPIQHASNKILKLMNRRGSKELIIKHINAIRKKVPNVIIRTTLITGFPYETSKDFNELFNLVKDIKFERMGAFMFSKEENTSSFEMKHQVPKFISKLRYKKLMSLQQNISLNFNKSLIGKEYDAVIDSYDDQNLAYIGRNYMFAPDDVDGHIYIYSPIELNIGDFVKIKIVDANQYDLYAKLI